MHLVCEAMEKHTIPASLPPTEVIPDIPSAPVAMQTAQPLVNNEVNYVNNILS
jgi:hypothetical protein